MILPFPRDGAADLGIVMALPLWFNNHNQGRFVLKTVVRFDEGSNRGTDVDGFAISMYANLGRWVGRTG